MLRRRVPVSLRPVFGAAAVTDKEALHSETEVRAALAGYAQREGLAVGDGAPLSGAHCESLSASRGTRLPIAPLLATRRS